MIVVCIVILVSVFPVISLAETTLSKTIDVVPICQPLTIDGYLTEWQQEQPCIIEADHEEKNFRAKVWLGYDKESLYVAFDVVDDSPMMNSGSAPSTAFKTGDTMEIFICVNPLANPSRHEPIQDDYRILMAYLKDKPVVHAFRAIVPGHEPNFVTSPGGTTRLDAVEPIPGARMQSRVKPERNGYSGEASLPWAYFGSFRPTKGIKIQCDFAVSFSDASGQYTALKIYWSGANFIVTDLAQELKLDPSRWGWMVFK